MKKAIGLFGILAITLALGTPAYASLTCSGTGSFYFSETGATSGDAQDAEGCVTIGAGTITVSVNDTVPAIGKLANILDAFDFTLSGGTPTTVTLLSVSVPLQFVDCISGPTCVTTTSFKSGGAGSPIFSPYGWGKSGSGATITAAAGGGSLHPGGITNGSIIGVSSPPGLSGPHNDLLLGSSGSPVMFNFSFSGGGTPTGVSAMNFYFGTNGDKQGGIPGKGSPPVPEPTSFLLLGTALALASTFLKKRLDI